VVAGDRKERQPEHQMVDRALWSEEGGIGAAEVAVVEPPLAGHVDHVPHVQDHAGPTGAAGQRGIRRQVLRDSILGRETGAAGLRVAGVAQGQELESLRIRWGR
jgi:hypothetical protein